MRCAELARAILAGPSAAIAAAAPAGDEVEVAGVGIWTVIRDSLVREVIRAFLRWLQECEFKWPPWIRDADLLRKLEELLRLD